ncbi:hypothetical protein BE11_43135 [Sorangium cellulosum]|nr:hypothetical protein BE11_43135 [Sorangium cellulosum]
MYAPLPSNDVSSGGPFQAVNTASSSGGRLPQGMRSESDHSAALVKGPSSCSGGSNDAASPSTQPWPVQGSTLDRVRQSRRKGAGSSSELSSAMKNAADGPQANPA